MLHWKAEESCGAISRLSPKSYSYIVLNIVIQGTVQSPPKSPFLQVLIGPSREYFTPGASVVGQIQLLDNAKLSVRANLALSCTQELNSTLQVFFTPCLHHGIYRFAVAHQPFDFFPTTRSITIHREHANTDLLA